MIHLWCSVEEVFGSLLAFELLAVGERNHVRYWVQEDCELRAAKPLFASWGASPFLRTTTATWDELWQLCLDTVDTCLNRVSSCSWFGSPAIKHTFY